MSEKIDQKLVILDVEEDRIIEEEETLGSYIKGILQLHGKISLEQKAVFFRIMATMVNASMSVVKSLDALRRQEKNKSMQQFYDFVLSRVQAGIPLHEALRSYHDNFSEAECSIIEAGERTGNLKSALLQVADQVEKMNSIAKKLKGALIYPSVLVVGMIAVVMVIMIKVIPSLLVFFGDPESLPDSTKMIMGISNFLKNYWFWMLVAVIFLFVMYSFWKKTAEGKYRNDQIMLRLPVAGPILQKVILSRFSRVFSNLLNSGVTIVEAIRIVASAVDNEVYRQRILLLRQDVKNGKRIAESLESDPLFPELLVSLLRTGEETAQMGMTIVKVADFYDEEVDISIANIQKLIEPFILVAMGITIAFIAIGVFEPLMGLAGTIGQ